jgi:hypothetical protein
MNLRQIKFAIRRLSLNRLKSLDEWLQALIRTTEEVERKGKFSRHKQTVAEQILDNKTYRLEKTRCGKEKCKCTRGELHGPYWYSYIHIKDKVKSQYVGKKLPHKVERELKRRDKT